MPFITAREDAGLSRTPNSQDIDAMVFAGQRLAVDWVQRQDNGNGLAEIRLAGNYTCPDSHNVLSVGDLRFLNSSRFEIPVDAWLLPSAAAAMTTPTSPLVSRQTMNQDSQSSAVRFKAIATELIRRYEGFSADAYPDPGTGGVPWTIGYGFTRIHGQAVQPGQTISKAEADILLDREIDDCASYLSTRIPFWAEMTAEQQCALTSFAFNNGRDFYGGPNHQTITRNLRQRDWNSVPQSLLLYVNPGSAVEAGLRRRREEEGRLWAQASAASPAPAVRRQSSAAPGLGSPASTNGLDPRGSEEQGMIGPRMRAPVQPGDTYLLVNDRDEDLEAYDHSGQFLWRIPCLARGQKGDREFNTTNSDTPPGLYKIGTVYRDYEKDPSDTFSREKKSYGWYSFDLVELENQESGVGRAGIMMHGGGSLCGWPGAWDPYQTLFPTCGCVRLHNADLRDKILPLVDRGTVYVGVFQEP